MYMTFIVKEVNWYYLRSQVCVYRTIVPLVKCEIVGIRWNCLKKKMQKKAYDLN